MPLLHLIKELHRLLFCSVADVNIRLHRVIVRMPRPLHHNIGRYAHFKRVTDECAPCRMGAYQLPLGMSFVNPFVALVIRYGRRGAYPDALAD